jgi:hypothetical protein
MTSSFLNIIICSYNVQPEVLISKVEKIAFKNKLSIRGVVVCNKKQSKIYNIKNWDIINGSNSILDFSAYYEGISFLLKDNYFFHNTLFLNDSLFLKHDYYFSLNQILKFNFLANEIKLPCLVGFRSFYSSICLENPWSKSPSFIPTYLFLLNTNAINVFLSLQQYAIKDEIFIENFFNSNKKLNPQFIELIKAHLIYKNSPLKWAGGDYYSVDNLTVNKKARCVYFEHRLSGEISKNGALLFVNAARLVQIKFLIREYIFKIVNFLEKRFIW